MRRAYLRISQKIHPDKLPTFADATKAFQACVRAYELICKPELRAMESDDSRDEEEVGDDDDEVVESTAQSQKRAGSSATQKPRKTRQPAEARKRAGATKSKKESFPGRDPPQAKKKRTRVSRASSSSGSEDDKFQADTSDNDDEFARGKPGTKGKVSKTKKNARRGSKRQAAKGDRFIDDDENEGWWSSSSSSAAGGDEGDAEESDLEQQPQQRQKPALPKFKKPRSNANCYRTPVTCPKCRAEWGAHLKAEGQEHTYSLFMQGVRQVHCLRCLFGDW